MTSAMKESFVAEIERCLNFGGVEMWPDVSYVDDVATIRTRFGIYAVTLRVNLANCQKYYGLSQQCAHDTAKYFFDRYIEKQLPAFPTDDMFNADILQRRIQALANLGRP